MFFCFVLVVQSTLFEWNPDKFDQIVKNSHEKPIFMVLYSTYCSHCAGLPEVFRQFSQNEGNRSDIYVTIVDCGKYHQCSRFQAKGTPNMIMIIGENPKYWPKTTSKLTKDWISLIDRYSKTSLRKISTSDELARVRADPATGTVFFLETPNEVHKTFKYMREQSKSLQIYNGSFVYKVNPSIVEPKLIAYVSQKCGVYFQPKKQTIDQFLKMYRFGSKHLFEWNELQDVQTYHSTVILVVEDGLTKGQQFILSNIPHNECYDTSYGWISSRHTFQIHRDLNFSKDDLPAVVVYSKAKTCISRSNVRAIDMFSSGFVKLALAGEICGSEFWRPPNVRKYDNIFEMNGKALFVVYISTVLLSIFLIQKLSNKKLL